VTHFKATLTNESVMAIGESANRRNEEQTAILAPELAKLLLLSRIENSKGETQAELTATIKYAQEVCGRANAAESELAELRM
jgi:hypothetical protein